VRFPSFWKMQMMGWGCFYLMGIVESVPDIFRRPWALRDNAVSLGFMFLVSSFRRRSGDRIHIPHDTLRCGAASTWETVTRDSETAYGPS
jgi:hypothetical protein